MRLLFPAAAFAFVGVLVSVIAIEGQSVSGQSGAKTVWDGVFTDTQAARGRTAFLANCAECHGGELQGRESRALKGDRFWSDWQATTVDYLLARISKSMPFSEDGSLAGTLGTATYADIVAHVLNTNGFPAGASELTAASSADVQIVRKDGSTELPVGAFVHVVGCLARRADRAWTLQKGSRPARVFEDQPPDVTVPLGDREYTLKFVLTSLDKYAGYRMSVRAALMPGGTGDLNVQSIAPVTATCD